MHIDSFKTSDFLSFLTAERNCKSDVNICFHHWGRKNTAIRNGNNEAQESEGR